MNTDLSDVLNTEFDAPTQAQNLPAGADIKFRVHKVRTDVVPNDKKTPFAELTLVPKEVVNADGLTTGDLVGYYPVKGKLWLSADSMTVTGDILRRSFRIDTAGQTVAQVLDNLIGAEVRATVKHRVTDQGKTFVEIDKWLRPAA